MSQKSLSPLAAGALPILAACLLLGLLLLSLVGNLPALAQQENPEGVPDQAVPQCGIFLFPMNQSKTGLPGETLTYRLSLYNFNPYPDSFSIEIGAETWTTHPENDQVGPVPAWGSQEVTVTVIIPENIQWLATDTAAVRARSVYRHTQVSNIAHLTTEIKNPLQFSFEPLSLESVQLPGQIVTQTITIRNDYDFTLTYRLSSPNSMPLDQWLSFPNASGGIPSKQMVTLPVVFFSTLRRAGRYTQDIYLDTNAPDHVHIAILVHMEVIEPPYRLFMPMLNN
jgi:hypothetical protein